MQTKVPLRTREADLGRNSMLSPDKVNAKRPCWKIGRANGHPPGRIVPMSPVTSRWRALGALLRPDALRWAGLGALVAVGSGLILTGPLIVREIVNKATEGTTSAELTTLAVLFLLVAI